MSLAVARGVVAQININQTVPAFQDLDLWIRLPVIVDDLKRDSSRSDQYEFVEKPRGRDVVMMDIYLRLLEYEGLLVDKIATALDAGLLREDPKDPTKFQVKAGVRICYPTQVGDKKWLAPRQKPYPVVAILHGNHDAFDYSRARLEDSGRRIERRRVNRLVGLREINNHAGYDYLQEDLARHGIVSISVNSNFANLLDAQLAMRAETLLLALQAFRALTERPRSRYFRKLDFDSVGLVGHSRGGDAVVAAVHRNQSSPHRRRLGIRAVCSLAPTDLSGIASIGRVSHSSTNVPYLVICCSKDGDVIGTKVAGQPDINGTGFRHYDRADAPKAMVFILGATHKRWNTEWPDPDFFHPHDTVPPFRQHVPKGAISEPDHKTLGKEYIGGFFRWHLSQETGLRNLFNGRQENSAKVPVGLQWEFGKQVIAIDRFDSPPFGNRYLQNISGPLEFAPTILGPTPSKRDLLVPHQTQALVIKIHSRGKLPLLREDRGIPPSATPFDLTHFEALTFRLGMSLGATRPRFELRLRDASDNLAAIDSSSIYAENPRQTFSADGHKVQEPKKGAPEIDATKVYLRTVYVPIGVILAYSPSVDPYSIVRIEFAFEPLSAGAEVYFDSLQLVRD